MNKKVLALTLSAALALSSTSAFAAEKTNTTKACFDYSNLVKSCYNNYETGSSCTKDLTNLTINEKSIDLTSMNWKSILQNKTTSTTTPTASESKETASEIDTRKASDAKETAPEVDTRKSYESRETASEVDIHRSSEPVESETTTTSTETTTESDTTVSPSNLSYEQEVVELVNVERQKYGLSDLTLDTSVSNVARTKSQDMADNNYFAHQSPTYGSAGDMLNQFGINWSAWGENIASGQKTPEAVVTAWMNSEGHKANILSSNFSKIGVGYAVNSSGTPYWTQMFTN
jgi:uncharacterized YkwD family protein